MRSPGSRSTAQLIRQKREQLKDHPLALRCPLCDEWAPCSGRTVLEAQIRALEASNPAPSTLSDTPHEHR